MKPAGIARLVIEDAVARALQEDLGAAGDITTQATIPPSLDAKAKIKARAQGIIAGVDAAIAAFRMVDNSLAINVEQGDGAAVKTGDTVLAVRGRAQGILTAERVALNFLGHLSGVATATHMLVDAIKGEKAKIVCTRKTTPGLRALEKYAVRCGGGQNHRFGLYDAVLIKDNHIAAAGGVAKAIHAAREHAGHFAKIEVETDTLAQVEEALGAGADIIMLDNMAIDVMKRAVEHVAGRAVLEASGNIRLDTVRAIAQTGVDLISSGWITHSAPNLDLGLDFA